jgi:hypothetical protein
MITVHGYYIGPNASLHGAYLRSANLNNVNLQYADFRGADLRGANLRDADLRGADFRGADLRGADFRGADFRGADLDYSCWPLWCGSKGVKLDSKQIDQLCLHLYWVMPDSKLKKGLKYRAGRAAKARDVEL